MNEDQSLKCTTGQTTKIEVCRQCGVHVGATHHHWCPYYPSHELQKYQISDDDEDYEVYF